MSGVKWRETGDPRIDAGGTSVRKMKYGLGMGKRGRDRPWKVYGEVKVAV